MEASRSLRAIYSVVARIPRGRVCTYGRVAALAGLPGRARLVGRALREVPAGIEVPWHRVLNAAGKISARGDALGHEDLQAHLLEREGVKLKRGAVSLEQFLWQARAATARSASKKPDKTTRAQRTAGGGAARRAAR